MAFMAGMALLVTAIIGCGSTNVEVVDLNKVLDVFAATLAELDAKHPGQASAQTDETAGTAGETSDASDSQVAAEQPSGQPDTSAEAAGGDEASTDVAASGAIDEEPGDPLQDAQRRQEFLARYASNLNTAKILGSSVGVEMTVAGDILGFRDANSDGLRDSGEKEIFKIQIDEENSRLIATDGTYYRDQRYRPTGGFFTGYLIGSMLTRNRSYYSGARASARPDFKNRKMSPKNYHAGAVSKARARTRSSGARSRSGSRGFSFGK
jgi:hypothetical protein